MTGKQNPAANKPGLRKGAGPATSLKDTDTVSVTQNQAGNDSGPKTVKPVVGAQAEGQTTRG